MFLTGIGALRENAKEDDPASSSSPLSMSHAYVLITEENNVKKIFSEFRVALVRIADQTSVLDH